MEREEKNHGPLPHRRRPRRRPVHFDPPRAGGNAGDLALVDGRRSPPRAREEGRAPRPRLHALAEGAGDEVDSTHDHDSGGDAAGTTIGPYKLLQQIGEGGFGIVYMAEQQEPVRRNVAIKIIKPGMDTKEVIARFEAERQALALMDHPHIAKVLDAGATSDSRPYFVMELVKGVST